MPPTAKFISKRGSQLISIMFNNVFYGVAMCMVAQYFLNHSHRDSVTTKLVVCILVISATLEVFFANAQMYDILVISFGKNLDIRGDIHFSVLGKYTTTFFTAYVAQLFYASRIWSIGINMGYMGRKMKFLAVPVAMLSALQLGAGLAQVIVMQISITFDQLGMKKPQLTKIVATQSGASAACDIVITASITYILQSSRSGIRRTDTLLESLIKYAIQRAAATSVCGVLTIFLYHYARTTYYFNLPCLINTDIHVMSVISLLISRENLREKLARPQVISGVVLETRDDDVGNEAQESATLT